MKGMVVSEEAHIVNVIPPIDLTGGVTGDRFKMDNHGHASIVISLGVQAAALTSIIVNECDAATAGTATAIPFTYYEQTTAAGDVLSAKQTVAATGITSPSANNGIFYVIEIDAQELSDGFNWIEVDIANPAQSNIGSVQAVLSGARFQNEASATAIA